MNLVQFGLKNAVQFGYYSYLSEDTSWEQLLERGHLMGTVQAIVENCLV